MQKIQRIKFNPHDLKIDRLWITSFVNPTKINEKNVIQISDNGKNYIKFPLLKSMSARLKWKKNCQYLKKMLQKKIQLVQQVKE